MPPPTHGKPTTSRDQPNERGKPQKKIKIKKARCIGNGPTTMLGSKISLVLVTWFGVALSRRLGTRYSSGEGFCIESLLHPGHCRHQVWTLELQESVNFERGVGAIQDTRHVPAEIANKFRLVKELVKCKHHRFLVLGYALRSRSIVSVCRPCYPYVGEHQHQHWTVALADGATACPAVHPVTK